MYTARPHHSDTPCLVSPCAEAALLLGKGEHRHCQEVRVGQEERRPCVGISLMQTATDITEGT